MKLRIIFAALSAAVSVVSTTGCGKALENLVAVRRPGIGAGTVIATPFENQNVVKISPGTVNSSSADISMRAHVTITDRALTGSDISARVSVARQRSAE